MLRQTRRLQNICLNTENSYPFYLGNVDCNMKYINIEMSRADVCIFVVIQSANDYGGELKALLVIG